MPRLTEGGAASGGVESPPSRSLFDTHVHLDNRQYAADLDAVVRRARAAGVGAMATISYDHDSCASNRRLAETYPDVYFTAGYHPYDAEDYLRGGEERLRELRGHPKLVGIGEIGLDYFRADTPRPAQRAAFVAQLELARELGLPVVIHNREADADVLAVLEDVCGGGRGPAGVMHCFSGDLAMAERCLALGFFIGIGGPVTYKNLRHLGGVALAVPVDRLVIETDCPYLAPDPFRGKRNEPAYVALVARRLAELRGVEPDELAAQTWRNAHALFRLPPPW